MKRSIIALALALAMPALADDTEVKPPHDPPQVSPTTKKKVKKALNWPGARSEQTDLQGNVSTEGQTHAEKVGRVTPQSAHH